MLYEPYRRAEVSCAWASTAIVSAQNPLAAVCSQQACLTTACPAMGSSSGLPGYRPSSHRMASHPAHLSSMRTQRSLNCRGRWCLLCLLCHFFCRPNSSSWLRLSGSSRCGDRAGSSSSVGAVGVTEADEGMAMAGVTGTGLAEVPSGRGAGLPAAGLGRGGSM